MAQEEITWFLLGKCFLSERSGGKVVNLIIVIVGVFEGLSET